MEKYTKRMIKKCWIECKKKPYLLPLLPLSVLGFVLQEGVNPNSVFGKIENKLRKVKK